MHQAIEGFALMVKKTAQTLQSFGTELAETELPNETQATTILLSTHTTKKDKMKVNTFNKPLTQNTFTVMCLDCSLFCLCVSAGGSAGGSGTGQQAAGEH